MPMPLSVPELMDIDVKGISLMNPINLSSPLMPAGETYEVCPGLVMVAESASRSVKLNPNAVMGEAKERNVVVAPTKPWSVSRYRYLLPPKVVL